MSQLLPLASELDTESAGQDFNAVLKACHHPKQVHVCMQAGALLGEIFFAKANSKLREQIEQRFFVVECVLNLLWRFSLPFLGNRLTLLVARDADTEVRCLPGAS